MFALSSLLMLLGVAVDVAVAQQAVREFLVPNALNAPRLALTGDVNADFFQSRARGVARIPDVSSTATANSPVSPDVGTPPSWPYARSGWDIESVGVHYSYERDELTLGIDCFAVCGDADGDGDAARSSDVLLARGGADLAALGSSESFVVALDVTLDGVFDFVLGVPAVQPAASQPFPCDAAKLDTSCFNLYRYLGVETADPYNRALWTTANGVLPHPTVNHNVAPTLAKPDLEWSILSYSDLLRKAAAPLIDASGVRPWSLQLRVFGGSFQDDGVGEDNVPNNGDFVRVTWPCQSTDACGVCGGNNSTCLDCRGTPNGPARYDACDVCAGTGATCRDCAGAPNGPAVYDVCDVCGGDGSTCRDCRGVAGGRAVYDKCGVCDGDGASCFVREQCSDSFTECSFRAGQQWIGTFNRTSRLPQVSSAPFTLTIGGDAYAAVTALGNRNGARNVPLATFLRFTIMDAAVIGLQQVDHTAGAVTLEEQRTLLRFGCSSKPAKYSLKFGNECRNLRIVPLYDDCAARRELFNDIMLSLAPCVSLPERRNLTDSPIAPDAREGPWAVVGVPRPITYGIPYAECAPVPGSVFALRYRTPEETEQTEETPEEQATEDEEPFHGSWSSSSSSSSSSDSESAVAEPVPVEDLGLLVVGPGVYIETSRHGAFMGQYRPVEEISDVDEGLFGFDACELAQQLRANASAPACKRTEHVLVAFNFDHTGWCRRAVVEVPSETCAARFDRIAGGALERLDVCGDAEPYVPEDIHYRGQHELPKHLQREHDDEELEFEDENTEFKHLWHWPKSTPKPTPFRVSLSEQREREHQFHNNAKPHKDVAGRNEWGVKPEDRRIYASKHKPLHNYPPQLVNRLQLHLDKSSSSSSSS